MSELKTLDQLWEENGCKPGLKVWHNPRSEYFVVMGKTPNGGYYGHDANGDPCGPDVEGATKRQWQSYLEPEELVDHWPGIVEYPNGFRDFHGIYENTEQGMKSCSNFIRLATELPPIKLPRRKG